MAFFDSMKIKKDWEINKEAVPSHIAIIMDGNGRWAQKRGLPRKAGHKAGADALENISRDCMKLGVKHLTVYAFSTENWKRSDNEVDAIMDLLRSYLKNYIERAKKDIVKVDIIGDKTRLAIDIQKDIAQLEELTKDKPGMALHIALNYGGRDEIVRAVKKIGEKIEGHALSAQDITPALLEKHLDTEGVPDPELLIRTSGEQRISNFLLWQIAYTELYFSDKLWPDFDYNELKAAIYQYQNRDRRFGGR